MSFDLSTLTTIALAFFSGFICRKTLGRYFANKIILLLNWFGSQLWALWQQGRNQLTTTMKHLPQTQPLPNSIGAWIIVLCFCLFSGWSWVYSVAIFSLVSLLFVQGDLAFFNLFAGLIFSAALFFMHQYYRASARELAAK